jgi:uroporphyrinogen-III decarboxylase
MSKSLGDKEMDSRERVLAAFRREEVDYLPCSIYFNANLQLPGYELRRAEERLRLGLDLGTDPVLDVGLSSAPGPEVTTRAWVEQGEPPTLFKEFATPAGTLRHGVRLTAEWPHGEDIPWNDFSAGHCLEPLVKTPADVEAFALVHRAPDRDDLERAREGIERGKALARGKGVAVRALAGQGLATLMFVMGAEHMVTFAVDHPAAFRRLAEVDSLVNRARIRLLADAGVDLLKRFGGYEMTNFFSPKIYERTVLPLLAEEVGVAREVGLPIYYRVVSGSGPLLGSIANLGFDCVEGFEPVLDPGCPLAEVKAALAGTSCVWTGVSSPGHLGVEGDGAVREAVRAAVETFGRRGFILGVTNSIRAHWPWENTLAMIDEWKRLR